MHTFWKISCVHWAVSMNVGYSWKASSCVWLMMEALSSAILSISFPVIEKPTVSNQTLSFKKTHPISLIQMNSTASNIDWHQWLWGSFLTTAEGGLEKEDIYYWWNVALQKKSPFKSSLNTSLSSPSSLSICSLNNTFVYGCSRKVEMPRSLLHWQFVRAII